MAINQRIATETQSLQNSGLTSSAGGVAPGTPQTNKGYYLQQGLLNSAYGRGLAASPKNTSATVAGAQQQRQQDQITAWINEYIQMLQKPIDLNDPYVQQVVTGARNAASSAARSRGIEGGMAVGASEQNAAGALGQLEADRRQRLQGALGLGAGTAQGFGGLLNQQNQLAESRYQFDTGMAANRWQQQQQMQQQNAQGIGAGLGLAAGTAGALALTPVLGPAAWALPGVGAQIGGGIGGLGAGVSQQPFMPPSRGGSRGY